MKKSRIIFNIPFYVSCLITAVSSLLCVFSKGCFHTDTTESKNPLFFTKWCLVSSKSAEVWGGGEGVRLKILTKQWEEKKLWRHSWTYCKAKVAFWEYHHCWFIYVLIIGYGGEQICLKVQCQEIFELQFSSSFNLFLHKQKGFCQICTIFMTKCCPGSSAFQLT